MQKIIEGLLVAVDQWVQFMRKGEYHMKIRGIDHLSPSDRKQELSEKA